MNTHGNLRPSCQYGAAGSQTLVSSAWGRCTCLAIPQTALKRQSEIISKLWNISEKRRKQTRHPQRYNERHIPTEIERNLKIGMFFPISYNWLIDYRVYSGERNCNPCRYLAHRFVILQSVCGTGCKPKMYTFPLVNMCHRRLIQHIPTDCSKQHCISIKPSPSSSYRIYPPNVISSMTYSSSCHRCVLTVVRRYESCIYLYIPL